MRFDSTDVADFDDEASPPADPIGLGDTPDLAVGVTTGDGLAATPSSSLAGVAVAAAATRSSSLAGVAVAAAALMSQSAAPSGSTVSARGRGGVRGIVGASSASRCTSNVPEVSDKEG